MIFLGAGASKPFGIKTLEEMSDDLVKMMQTEGFSEIVEEISNSLMRFGMTPDFEAIYTIVEGLTNPSKAVKKTGPFTAYVCTDLKKLKSGKDLKGLLPLFRNFLYEECKIKRGHHKEIKSVYNRLFQVLRKSGVLEERYIPGLKAGKQPSVKTGYTMVTTNYDMVVELFHRIMKQQYADGFRQTLDPFIKEIDMTTFSLVRQRWLIKLHGSIWQYRYKNSYFKTVEDPRASSIPIEIEDEMMIYPTGEKPTLEDPYYEFYNLFRIQRWQKLVVIGYSFRDDPVNIAILENLQRVPDSNLIVINPDPDKVVKNLGDLARSKLDNRIIPVEGRFGDRNTFKKLEIALKVRSKHRYFSRLRQTNLEKHREAST